MTSTKALNSQASMDAASSRLGRPGWLDENLYPFESRYVEIDGHQVHYVDEGSGPVLLFLHSNLVWSFIYRDIIKGLRGRFRCVALDFPGFGLSQTSRGFAPSIPEYARVVEKFIEKLDLRDITLAVHDSGGAIGLGVAGRQPGRFRALVISNTFAWPLDDYNFIRQFLGFAGSSLLGFLNVNFNLLPRLFTSFGVGSRKLSKSEKQAYLGPFGSRSSRRAIHLMFRSLANSREYLVDVRNGLEHIKGLPVLFAWSTGDAATKAGFLEKFQREFPNHRVEVVYEGSMATGHFPQESAPEKFVVAIRNWWEEVVENESAAGRSER